MNKQLGQLNEKMVTNMGELRNQYNIEMNEERIDILAGVQSQFQVQRATTTDDEILDRKKAIIELEREQREVQRDIKSLMKFEPASRILTEDPALADRVSQQRIGHPTQERVASNERKPAEPQKRQWRASDDY